MKNYFFYVGNAYPHKNLKKAIEATLLLNKENEMKTSFVIVSGRGVFRQRLEKTVAQLKGKEFVKVLGFVSDKKLESLYKNSLAFVYPSFYEGFGLPGLEAMKAGTLVLASNIPVFKEVYQNQALYFNPDNSESIKKAMEKVLKLKETQRETLIKKGREFSRQYSWAKMAKETLALYNETL